MQKITLIWAVFNIFDNMKWHKKFKYLSQTSCTLGENMFINLQDDFFLQNDMCQWNLPWIINKTYNMNYIFLLQDFK
jgi:hypothetical protein